MRRVAGPGSHSVRSIAPRPPAWSAFARRHFSLASLRSAPCPLEMANVLLPRTLTTRGQKAHRRFLNHSVVRRRVAGRMRSRTFGFWRGHGVPANVLWRGRATKSASEGGHGGSAERSGGASPCQNPPGEITQDRVTLSEFIRTHVVAASNEEEAPDELRSAGGGGATSRRARSTAGGTARRPRRGKPDDTCADSGSRIGRD